MIHINEEVSRCLLCENAPCGEKAARAVRALRFENLWTARELFDQLNDAEIEAAQAACIHYDQPIRRRRPQTAYYRTEMRRLSSLPPRMPERSHRSSQPYAEEELIRKQ